jgi:O-antigen ligase
MPRLPNIRKNANAADQADAGARDTLVPTAGVFWLLLFVFVIFSMKLPLGEVAAIGSILAALARRTKTIIPTPLVFYSIYVVWGALGVATSSFPGVVTDELFEVVKFTLFGFALSKILTTHRDCRTFSLGYLALFALFPVRGSVVNFLVGAAQMGRVAWTGSFNNPNDLAIYSFLPIGLCGYMYFTERGAIKFASMAGVGSLIAIQLLTQSRGGLLGLIAALALFVVCQKQRIRMLLGVGVLGALAAAFTPASVWDRMGGLGKASAEDMSQVDPEGSAASRWVIMKIGTQIFMQSPVFGVGMGAYPLVHAAETARRDDVIPTARGGRDAHSTYIRSAAEVGLPGLIAMLGCMLSALIYVTRARSRFLSLPGADGSIASALSCLQCSIIGFAIAALFNSSERTTYFLLQFTVPWLLARVLLMDHIDNQKPQPAGSGQRAHARR